MRWPCLAVYLLTRETQRFWIGVAGILLLPLLLGQAARPGVLVAPGFDFVSAAD